MKIKVVLVYLYAEKGKIIWGWNLAYDQFISRNLVLKTEFKT